MQGKKTENLLGDETNDLGQTLNIQGASDSQIDREFSNKEKQVIREAIKIVRDQRSSYTNRDFFQKLSPFNYFLGFANVVMTAFFVGHWPE